MTHPIDRPDSGRRVLLLDLVHTLAIRQGSWGTRDYAEVIRATETYRLPLLQRVQAEGWFVILLTARSHRYAEVTLENIRRHTGWQPDVSIFNEHGQTPPFAKLAALCSRIYPVYGDDRSRYFALESNRATRAMYAGQKIEAMRWEDYLAESSDQPCLEGFENLNSVNQFIGDGNPE